MVSWMFSRCSLLPVSGHPGLLGARKSLFLPRRADGTAEYQETPLSSVAVHVDIGSVRSPCGRCAPGCRRRVGWPEHRSPRRSGRVGRDHRSKSMIWRRSFDRYVRRCHQERGQQHAVWTGSTAACVARFISGRAASSSFVESHHQPVATGDGRMSEPLLAMSGSVLPLSGSPVARNDRSAAPAFTPMSAELLTAAGRSASGPDRLFER